MVHVKPTDIALQEKVPVFIDLDAALFCTIALTALLLLTTSSWAQGKVTPAEARAIAKDAYIFNYPMVMMYRSM